MKQPFGANLVRSCSRFMHWIAANHRKEDRRVGVDDCPEPPTRAMIAQFRARLVFRPIHFVDGGHPSTLPALLRAPNVVNRT
jgi:hypothetical protein